MTTALWIVIGILVVVIIGLLLILRGVGKVAEGVFGSFMKGLGWW